MAMVADELVSSNLQ